MFITENKPGPLTAFAASIGATTHAHPRNLGGRYSGFSVVGMLPALLAGHDCQALLAGAEAALHDLLTLKEHSHPGQAAATMLSFHQRGIRNMVMMPYTTLLEGFGEWQAQLFAESLGKQGQGFTPIRAEGPLDQHSQLQLYLDGPRDKWLHLYYLPPSGAGISLGSTAPTLPDYLQGRRLADIQRSEYQALCRTLSAHNIPYLVTEFTRFGPYELGALLMNTMLTVAILGTALGVNPYDQPAVEAMKQAALEILEG